MKKVILLFSIIFLCIGVSLQSQSVDPTYGTWKINKIMLSNDKKEILEFYKEGSSENLMDFSKVTFEFKKDGTAIGNSITGVSQPVPYIWKLSGNTLYIDGEPREFKLINENELLFIQKGGEPVIDIPFDVTEITLVRSTNSVSQKDEPVLNKDKLKLSPNPVKTDSEMLVELPPNLFGNISSEIRNLSGERIMGYHQHFPSNRTEIYIPTISSGTYLLVLTVNKRTYTKQFQVIGN